MVNQDCDGRHKICDFLPGMSKVSRCRSGIACNAGIPPPNRRAENSRPERGSGQHR